MIGSHSSLKTILSTINTMLGSTTLIVPVIFANIGIVTALIAMTLLCTINFITARILLRHGKTSEDDLPEMIYRILGLRYFQFFSLISSMLCFLVAIVYFLLQISMLYNSLWFILHFLQIEIAEKTEIVFNQFSFQYVTIVMIVIQYALINLKNLKVLMKVSSYGTISVILYLLFILLSFL